MSSRTLPSASAIDAVLALLPDEVPGSSPLHDLAREHVLAGVHHDQWSLVLA